jgi:hypothetical protein
MAHFNHEHRNNSFPPCQNFTHRKHNKFLSPPVPEKNIEEDPWSHFLSPITDDDDDDDIFLDFNAGIITSSEVIKKKPVKFRPSTAKKWDHKRVNYHHGAYSRKEKEHGFVENRLDPWSHVVEHDINRSLEDLDGSDLQTPRPRGRSKSRTSSGHRRSWREPSADLFVLEEEKDDTAAVPSSKGEKESAAPKEMAQDTAEAVSGTESEVRFIEWNGRAKL